MRSELKEKIIQAKEVISEFYKKLNGNVYISFSGGKDSTVMLHLIRSVYPNVKAVFCDTGLEFPEIKKFVKTIENVDIIKPTRKFYDIVREKGIPYPNKEVAVRVKEIQYSTDYMKNIRRNGYPSGAGKLPKKWLKLVDYEQKLGIKVTNSCCYYLKKSPFDIYTNKTKKHPYIGTTISESNQRRNAYYKYGFNIYGGDRTTSKPISLFNDTDIWEYINYYKLDYSDIYKKGYKRTGCMFCLFGITMEKGENRIQKLKRTHPKQYKYIMELPNYKKLFDLEKIEY